LLAGAFIGLLVLSIPLGFVLISYQHEMGSLETEAEIKARVVSGLASSNPRFWTFEHVRIQELISNHKSDVYHEAQRVFDSSGELITENRAEMKQPLITQTANVYDSGVMVGRVELTRSLFPVIEKAGLILLVLLPAGAAGFLVIYLLPIQMLRRSEEGLKRSEEKYRRLMAIANDAIFVADASTGIILDANKKAEVLIGKSLNAIIGMHQSELHPGEDAEQYRKFFEESVQGEVPVVLNDLWVVNSAGQRIPVDISASVTELEGKKVIMGIFRDVTQRKKIEEALRVSQARYAQAADVAHLGHWERDIVTSQGYWSREAYAIFGVSPDTFEPTFDNLVNLIHPLDRDAFNDAVAAALSDGGKLDIEYRIISPDGDTRVLQSRGELQLNDKGEGVKLVGTVQDVTERRHIEETLRWAEQLKIVAQITKGLAEDIRNSLAGIKACIEVLGSEHAVSGEDMAIKVNAMNEIKRIKETISSLIQFARAAEPELLMVNINDILDQTIAFSLKHPSFAEQVLSKIAFTRIFDNNIPETLADPQQLQQIFLNLIFNSFEAMPGGGSISVSTSYDRERNYIQIAIADTGGGIEEKLKDRIFEPFFSTKPKGTGLGLPIAMRMVRQCGGELNVDSNSGGTVMIVKYPVRKLRQ